MESELSWTEEGSPTGPALVCLHGFLGEGSDWLAFVRHLSKQKTGWRIILPDLPAHGKSPPLPLCSVEQIARSVWRLLDDLSLNNVVFAGYSLGGRVALQAAAMVPDRCRGLIGISTGPGIGDAAERESRITIDALLADKLRKIQSHSEWDVFSQWWWDQEIFRSPYWTSELRNSRRKVVNDLSRNPQGLARVVEEASPARMSDLREDLGGFHFPCLFLAGECDHKYSKLAEEMAMTCHFGKSSILQRHGHSLLLEAPEDCARLVDAWLSKCGDIGD